MTDIGYSEDHPRRAATPPLRQSEAWQRRLCRLKELRQLDARRRSEGASADADAGVAPHRAEDSDALLDLVDDRMTQRERVWYAIAVVVPVLIMAHLTVPMTSHIVFPRAAIYGGALLMGALALRWALEEPLFLLLLITAYMPFQRALGGTFGGAIPAFNFTNVLLALLTLAWMARARYSPERAIRYHRLDIPVLLFVVIGSVALLRAEISRQGGPVFGLLNPWWRWIAPFFIYFAVVNMVKTKKEIRLILLAVCFTTVVIGLIGFKEGYIDRAHYGKLDKRRISVGTTPNDLGALFAYYLPYLFALVILNWHRLRYHLLWPLLAICVRASIITYSRGGQLALAGGTLALLALTRIKIFILVIVPVVVVMAIYPGLIPVRLTGRLSQTVVEQPIDHMTGEVLGAGIDSASEQRLKIWSAALRMIADRPLTGFGYGSFSHIVPSYDPELVVHRADGTVVGRDAHSAYLRLAAEQGVPALALLLLVFTICGAMALHVFRHSGDGFYRVFSAGYFGGLIGLIIANVFGSRFETNEITMQFWILTGCLAVVYRSIGDRHRREESNRRAVLVDNQRATLGLNPAPQRRRGLWTGWDVSESKGN